MTAQEKQPRTYTTETSASRVCLEGDAFVVDELSNPSKWYISRRRSSPAFPQSQIVHGQYCFPPRPAQPVWVPQRRRQLRRYKQGKKIRARAGSGLDMTPVACRPTLFWPGPPNRPFARPAPFVRLVCPLWSRDPVPVVFRCRFGGRAIVQARNEGLPRAAERTRNQKS